MQFKMSFKCLKKSTSTQQSLHYRKMNSISMAMDESCKWQRTETDNRSNIAPPCHQCFHILCPRAVSECFFILFPPPASLVCETPPSLHTRAHPLNLQPAESTWKQFSFNQVHYKSPSDANLSNTTILVFFPQLHPLISLWAIWNAVYLRKRICRVYCSFWTDANSVALLDGFKFEIVLKVCSTYFHHLFWKCL